MRESTKRALLVIGGVAALMFATGWRVIVKDGVVLALAPEMARAWWRIVQAHRSIGIRDPIVTSGSEGQHMAGSLHYVGKAVDLRTRDLSSLQVVQLIASLRAWLGEDFDVIDESNHIHVEYDA